MNDWQDIYRKLGFGDNFYLENCQRTCRVIFRDVNLFVVEFLDYSKEKICYEANNDADKKRLVQFYLKYIEQKGARHA